MRACKPHVAIGAQEIEGRPLDPCAREPSGIVAIARKLVDDEPVNGRTQVARGRALSEDEQVELCVVEMPEQILA